MNTMTDMRTWMSIFQKNPCPVLLALQEGVQEERRNVVRELELIKKVTTQRAQMEDITEIKVETEVKTIEAMKAGLAVIVTKVAAI